MHSIKFYFWAVGAVDLRCIRIDESERIPGRLTGNPTTNNCSPRQIYAGSTRASIRAYVETWSVPLHWPEWGLGSCHYMGLCGGLARAITRACVGAWPVPLYGPVFRLGPCHYTSLCGGLARAIIRAYVEASPVPLYGPMWRLGPCRYMGLCGGLAHLIIGTFVDYTGLCQWHCTGLSRACPVSYTGR